MYKIHMTPLKNTTHLQVYMRIKAIRIQMNIYDVEAGSGNVFICNTNRVAISLLQERYVKLLVRAG